MNLSNLEGVGPVRLETLRAVGIVSLRDLLFTLPVRYEDHHTEFLCSVKTPGNILVRNCSFVRMKKLFNMPFGHRWTCNRSLADITFENCLFDGVRAPITSSSDPETPFRLCIKDSTVIAREGSEEIAFAEMQDCNELILEAVSIENFNDPRVVCPMDCNVTIYNTSPLRVERAE